MRSTLLTLASFVAIANAEIALYWGQNSGGGQETLRHYCENSPSDLVLLSFVNKYPDTQVNFANQCGATFSDGLLHCPQIGEDITACQAMGKKVLLTLGGAVGPYGFDSNELGAQYAHTLTDMFGPVNPKSEANRPFDNAVVDGYNFDPEEGSASPYTALAKELKTINPATLLGAAPQCVYPDAFVGDALLNAEFDYVFVQFYNNYCNLDKDFNWSAWSDYAKNVSPNKNVKIFVGLPGSTAAAGSGYVSTEFVKSKLSVFENDPAFGGFAIWDASASEANKNYAQQLVDISKRAPSAPASSASASASSSSASSSSASSSSVKSAPTTAPKGDAPSSSVAPPRYGNFTTAKTSLDSTSASTDDVIHTTLITITSCEDQKCTEVPVVTGYVTVTSDETEYITYCPLSGESHSTAPATKASSEASVSSTTLEAEAVVSTCESCTEAVASSSSPNTEAAPSEAAPSEAAPSSKPVTTVSAVSTRAVESLAIQSNTDVTSTISTTIYVTARASSIASAFQGEAGSNKLGLGAAFVAAVALLF